MLHLLQREVASDRGMVTAASSRILTITVRPMGCRVKDVINASMPWSALGRIRPREAAFLEVTFETASLHFVEMGSVRIHVANYNRRRILRTELFPLLQKHLCDLGVRPGRAGLVVVVRQVGVEEPDRDVAEFELPPSDVTGSIVVPWNLHVSTAHKSYSTAVVQHVVLRARLRVRSITRCACQSVPVLAFLKPDYGWSYCPDLFRIARNPCVVISILRVVAHDFYRFTLGGRARSYGTRLVIVLRLRPVTIARIRRAERKRSTAVTTTRALCGRL